MGALSSRKLKPKTFNILAFLDDGIIAESYRIGIPQDVGILDLTTLDIYDKKFSLWG